MQINIAALFGTSLILLVLLLFSIVLNSEFMIQVVKDKYQNISYIQEQLKTRRDLVLVSEVILCCLIILCNIILYTEYRRTIKNNKIGDKATTSINNSTNLDNDNSHLFIPEPYPQ